MGATCVGWDENMDNELNKLDANWLRNLQYGLRKGFMTGRDERLVGQLVKNGMRTKDAGYFAQSGLG